MWQRTYVPLGALQVFNVGNEYLCNPQYGVINMTADLKSFK